MSTDVLIDQKYGRSAGSATPHLMSLRGRRLTWASESSMEARLNVSQVKHLTGGGEIPARQLHREETRFNPTHMLFLLTNYKPRIPADDDPIWERVKLIAFTQRFIDEPTQPNEHKRDPALIETLRSEASGILAELVRGCLAWKANGLGTPTGVSRATAEYRAEEDTIGQFVKECCIEDPASTARASELYDAYKQWAEKTRAYPLLSGTAFGTQMGRRFQRREDRKGNLYIGIRFQ